VSGDFVTVQGGKERKNEGYKRFHWMIERVTLGEGYLLRCTFYNPYTARLSESEKNVHLSYVASGVSR